MALNAEQLAAVTSPAPRNIVVAGPGSGKSRVVVERARHLVAAGRRPEEMAFCTFTNVGARVLKRRLLDAVGKCGFVGTLHALLLTLLRRADGRWVLIGEEDAGEFLERSAKLMGYRGSAVALAEERRKPTTDGTSEAARVVRSYRQFMRQERMLDYDMVLSEGYALLHRDPGTNPWPIWFVDEFQDSVQIDAEIYRAAGPEHLFLVGDSDQSIFRFRGARPENVTDFWKDERFARHTLSLNYRCAEEICALANAVIERNRDRIQKRTESAYGAGGEVEAHILPTDGSERATVARLAAQRMAVGIAPHGIAVLCRTNALVNLIAAELKSAGLPVAEAAPEKKPKDWRLVQMILQQIATPTSWSNARLLAREMARIAKTDLAAAEKAVEAARAAGRQPGSLWAFPPLRVILSLNADLSRYGVGKASHELLAERIRVYQPESIEMLLECLRASPESKSQRGINIMTVHAAKGEEWPAVIIAGAEQFAGSEIEDERRLFFVAVTRAEKYLAVTCARQRMQTLQNGVTTFVTREPGELFDLASSRIFTPV